MSGTRALRDRLEQTQAELRRAKQHLEKLRAHQAREREALQQQLEEARREVAALRGRLHAVESARAEPSPPSGVVLPEPVSSERPATALVALVRGPASLESSVPVLSRLLNLAPVDVRLRLAPAPPTVLARLPGAEAVALRESLRAEGFHAVSCEVPPAFGAGWMEVKRFSFEGQELSLEGALGQRRQVPYAELRLLVHGRKVSTQVELKDEVVEYQVPAAGRRYMSRRQVEEKREQVGHFLWLMGNGLRAAMTQSTQFGGLGGQLAFTVHGNLQRLIGELRRRAAHLVVDERLVQLPRFAMPLVNPERSQELLAELLFQAVVEGVWP